MSDGMSDMAWDERQKWEEMAKKRINDITPAEWDAMAARGRETQAKFYNLQKPTDDFMADRFKIVSDGSTASYYELPSGAGELQDLISYKNMNAQIGEIFRECYRYGQASHSDELRGIKKILFYANAELKRIEGK